MKTGLLNAPMRVLLVEPNTPVRELLGEYLRGRGVYVTAVESAGAARLAWSATRHDVLITETALPDADSTELLRQCAAEAVAGGCCGLLAMSGALSVVETIATMRAGAEDVLLKPLRLREVYEAIRASSGRARVRAREQLGRELLSGAARCRTQAEASALRAILLAESDLLAGDAALAEACARIVAMAEHQCR